MHSFKVWADAVFNIAGTHYRIIDDLRDVSICNNSPNGMPCVENPFQGMPQMGFLMFAYTLNLAHFIGNPKLIRNPQEYSGNTTGY